MAFMIKSPFFLTPITIMTEQSLNTETSDKSKDDLLNLQPPHNMDIERALLASLMSIDDSFDKVDGVVSADDFYGDRHKLIFEAISHLNRVEQPYDTIMVYDYLATQNLLEQIGGEAYLMQINQSPATLFNLVPYAERVKEFSVYRKLIKSANNMLSLAYHPKKQSIGEILDLVEADIFQIGESYSNKHNKQGVRKSDDILVDLVNKLQHIKNQGSMMLGLETPFLELNNKTQGLQDGDLIIVAARPSMGKTTFAMNLAEIPLANGEAVVVFSMEMPSEAILMRMLSSMQQINQTNLRSASMSEEEWIRFANGVSFFQDFHLYVDDRNNLSPSEMRATCRRIAKNHTSGIGMIIVDYLQLMKVPGYKQDNRTQEISEISRSLKALAREMNCPVIALSQLNRGLETRNDKRPVMADLRESGAIEQDADLILFIYREEVYRKDEKSKREVAGQAELIIGKQRNGPIGKIPLRFIGEFTKFDNPEFVPADFEEE